MTCRVRSGSLDRSKSHRRVLFLLAEPTRWMPARALALVLRLEEEEEDEAGRGGGGGGGGGGDGSVDDGACPLRYAWLDVRPTAAPPSILLLIKGGGSAG